MLIFFYFSLFFMNYYFLWIWIQINSNKSHLDCTERELCCLSLMI